MVVIRLSRTGTNKRPFYHVVAADRRFSRDGRYLERLGFYNPIAKGPEIYLNLDQERVNYWVNQGAQPSERVEELIKVFSKTGVRTGAEYIAQTAPVKALAKAKKKAKVEAEKQEINTENTENSESSGQ